MPTTPLTDKEAFAGVLAGLVLARCTVARSAQVSRDALQASVPLNERPYVRRGLDALVEHGVLFASDAQIGFTEEGTAFLAFVRRMQPDGTPTQPGEIEARVTPLRALIARDPRLVPPKAIDDIRTLPGRLEEYRPARASGGLWRTVALLAAVGAAAAGAVLLLR